MVSQMKDQVLELLQVISQDLHQERSIMYARMQPTVLEQDIANRGILQQKQMFLQYQRQQ